MPLEPKQAVPARVSWDPRHMAAAQKHAVAQDSLSCCEMLWCVKVQNKAEIVEWMLNDARESTPPSACGRALRYCEDAYPRRPNCIQDVDPIRQLAGVMIESKGVPLAGSVFTKRWMDFDKEARYGEIKTYGGAGHQYSASQWSAGSSFLWYIGAWCDRLSNQSYGFQFSDDWRSASMVVKVNPCVCVPWLPAWYTVPSCCILSDMVQTEASADGSEWDRRTAACPLCCGDEMRHTYYLRNVIQPDGTPGKFHAELEALADEKMVTAR